jgi:hypothetical protein
VTLSHLFFLHLCVEISAREVLIIILSGNLIVGTGQGFGFEQPMEGQTNDWLTPPVRLPRHALADGRHDVLSSRPRRAS